MPESLIPVNPFAVKFTEAIDFLKGKLPAVSLNWDDVAGPVHSKVFIIAGATSVDLVRDLHGAVIRAIENGTTISQFRKDFDKAVAEHGWSYNGKRGWRTRVIFDTNMHSARMAGRWQQLQANKSSRPYLQYRTAGDARVRPLHRQWDGLVYPIDDAFWTTHYPPNGWRCRCTVRAYGGAELEKDDRSVSKPFELRTREVITRAGEIKDRVPVGIDSGWDYNVGKAWTAPGEALGQKLAALPPVLRGILTDKTITPEFVSALNDGFNVFLSGVKAASKPQGMAQIVGFFDSAVLNKLADSNMDVLSSSVAVVDNKTLHLEGAHKSGMGTRSAPRQVWPREWVESLPARLQNYRAVLLDKTTGNLVFIPKGSFNQTLPKIVVRLNQQTKAGVSATVVSLGTAQPFNLKEDKAYQLLIGVLDDK